MKHLTKKVVLVLLAVCCAAVSPAPTRSEGLKSPIIVNGGSNEDSKAALALLAQTIREDEFVILVARLGSRESTRRHNQRRMRAVQSYIDVTRPAPFPVEKIVTAEGQSASGQG